MGLKYDDTEPLKREIRTSHSVISFHITIFNRSNKLDQNLISIFHKTDFTSSALDRNVAFRKSSQDRVMIQVYT